MSNIKVAVLGAGSFVFGPSVLKGAILDQKLSGLEIALMDPVKDVVEGMAGVGQRMAKVTGVDVKVTAHTDRVRVMEGADFVICSAARELHRRFAMDCEIAERLSPGHLITEFGGIAGTSYSLRQIALMQEIAADMRRLCPSAWLLNVANPLPRVSQAAHEEGIHTAGFCSASLMAYSHLWRLFHGEGLTYPFEPARSRMEIVMAGTNHFTFVVEARDQKSHGDLLEEIRRRGAEVSAEQFPEPATRRLLRETGYLATPGDNHIKDFIIPRGETPDRQVPGHGSDQERQRRLTMLREIADGKRPWDELIAHESWEKPMDLVAAMAFGRRATFTSLNLINAGQIAALPANVFVETPATGTASGPVATAVKLPDTVVGPCRSAAQVSDTIVRAARQRSRKLVYEALDMDPTVVDKPGAHAAIDQCMRAHADLLPAYS